MNLNKKLNQHGEEINELFKSIFRINVNFCGGVLM